MAFRWLRPRLSVAAGGGGGGSMKSKFMGESVNVSPVRSTDYIDAKSLRIKSTPNPNSLSFLVSGAVTGGDETILPEGMTCEAPHRMLSVVHPLCNLIFEQYEKEVQSVFMAPRYVTITKFPHVDWENLDLSLQILLDQWILTEGPIPPDEKYAMIDDDTKVLDTDSEVVQIIKELLRDELRPMVQRDGGDLKFINFNEKSGICSVALMGACRSCPSSEDTLKNGIERMLMHFLPEVTKVVEVKGHVENSDYDLVIDSEKKLYEEFRRVDLQRMEKLKRPTRGKGLYLSVDALMEPDGD